MQTSYLEAPLVVPRFRQITGLGVANKLIIVKMNQHPRASKAPKTPHAPVGSVERGGFVGRRRRRRVLEGGCGRGGALGQPQRHFFVLRH